MSQPQHNALETPAPAARPHGDIPNTPLASATIAFLLGATFNFGLACIVFDLSSRLSFLTWQLGFFISAWSFFHWAEFAVTAGWNLEKCSVDCESRLWARTAAHRPLSIPPQQRTHVPRRTLVCASRISRHILSCSPMEVSVPFHLSCRFVYASTCCHPSELAQVLPLSCLAKPFDQAL